MACCPRPSPLGAVQLVPHSATGERVEHLHGGVHACLPTPHTQVRDGGGGELNVPTPCSGGVALGFPLPKEGQPLMVGEKIEKLLCQKEKRWRNYNS